MKSLLAGVGTLAIAGASTLGLAGAAFAGTGGGTSNPAWEPDPNSATPYGQIVFYDASGNVVTSGTNLSNLFTYAAATTPSPQNPTPKKASLFFAAPDHTQPQTALWGSTQTGGNTAWPNTTAPAPINGATFTTNPVWAAVGTGQSPADLNSALGGLTLDSTPGFANIIQVRLTSTNTSPNYWSTDIAYNTGGSAITVDGVSVAAGGWAQLFPNYTTTTTALGATPASPQNNPPGATQGQTVSLTATVSPSTAAGTVQFFDGSTSLGTSPVSGGTATGSAPTPSFGTHSYTAVFTPTGGTEVVGSSSTALSYVVNPPQTPTTTGLSGPATAAQYSSVSYAATVTPVPSPDGGNFAFTATGTGSTTGTTSLGTMAEVAGAGTLNISSLTLAPGTYNVTATFTPTSSAFATSTSPPVALTVTAPTCKGAPDPSGATCSDTQNIQVTVNPGSLTITTPYTAANPFVLPAMQLNAGATLLQSSATFPKAGDGFITVHSSLAGNPNWTVSVTDTDLSCASGSCTTPVSGQYQSINGENLGLTGGVSDAPSANFLGTVGFTAIPPANGVSPTDATGGGLKGGPHTFATSSGGGDGTVNMAGTLSLNAPTATQAGTYTGTVTFTVG
jgi:hypothetical protein